MTAPIVVGQLGAGFIGKVHSLAYRGAGAAQRYVGAPVELRVIADRDPALAQEAARQYGWAETAEDWRTVIDDPDVVLFDNAAPNHLHLEPCVAAAAAGKHVLCEKPLAPSAAEAFEAWRCVESAGVLHQCAFMYRFIPALQHARELIGAGELGEILHYRSQFLLSFANDRNVPTSWRFDRDVAGAGALGDLGSHHIDLARFLVGEVSRVASLVKTVIPQREGGTATNDDVFAAIAELDNGATAVFEASRIAGNHALTSRIEVDGTRGSLGFEFERLNEIRVARRGEPGFSSYLVSGAAHPLSDFWLPVGIQGQHPISWTDCFAHQAHAMLAAISGEQPLVDVTPTFRDGYRVAQVVDTIEAAAQERRWLPVEYSDLGAAPAKAV